MMSDTARITILVDNKADAGLLAEHGLAFWIETTNSRILFDTGQGRALLFNAELLGIDLRKADAVVLSHGHYDHSGGLPSVVQQKPDIHLYCHPAAVLPRYSIRSADQPKAVHMPQDAKSALNQMSSDHLHWVAQPTLLAPNIGITGPIPRNNDFEDTGGPFFLDSGGQLADPLQDDQALWIKTSRGLVIIVGCSHAGLVNTLRYIQEITGELSVAAVIGGFHLQNASEERLKKTTAALHDVGLVVPCHCIGEAALESLSASLGDRVKRGRVGLKLTIGERLNDPA